MILRSFTSFDYPGAPITEGRGINDRGDVVGYYSTSRDPDDLAAIHGFVLAAGAFSTLAAPPGTRDMRGAGINQRGDVCGSHVDEVGRRGFLIVDGAFQCFDFVEPDGTVRSTVLRALNDAGDLAGEYEVAPRRMRAFTRIGGEFRTIDFPGATHISARTIDERGRVAGYFEDDRGLHCFVAAGDEIAVLEPHGVDPANARHGLVVGTFWDGTPRASPAHGYVIHDGVWSPVDYPGAAQTWISAGNAGGRVVGSYLDQGGLLHGFTADLG